MENATTFCRRPPLVPGHFLWYTNDIESIFSEVTVMAEYELVREIPNLCRNNQMRDVFFSEVETEDPMGYVRQFLKGKDITLSSEQRSDGTVTVYAVCDGLTQKFIFTPI